MFTIDPNDQSMISFSNHQLVIRFSNYQSVTTTEPSDQQVITIVFHWAISDRHWSLWLISDHY